MFQEISIKISVLIPHHGSRTDGIHMNKELCHCHRIYTERVSSCHPKTPVRKYTCLIHCW